MCLPISDLNSIFLSRLLAMPSSHQPLESSQIHDSHLAGFQAVLPVGCGCPRVPRGGLGISRGGWTCAVTLISGFFFLSNFFGMLRRFPGQWMNSCFRCSFVFSLNYHTRRFHTLDGCNEVFLCLGFLQSPRHMDLPSGAGH